MQKEENDKIPLFSKWRYWYLLIILVLILEIIFFFQLNSKFS